MYVTVCVSTKGALESLIRQSDEAALSIQCGALCLLGLRISLLAPLARHNNNVFCLCVRACLSFVHVQNARRAINY